MNDILRISIPMTIWIAAFSAIYGLQGIVCSPHWAAAGLDPIHGRIALIGASAVAIAVQLAAIMVLRKPQLAASQPWMRRLSVVLAVVALLATIWGTAPVVATSLCL